VRLFDPLETCSAGRFSVNFSEVVTSLNGEY